MGFKDPPSPADPVLYSLAGNDIMARVFDTYVMDFPGKIESSAVAGLDGDCQFGDPRIQ